MEKYIGLGVLVVLAVFTASFAGWYFTLPDQGQVLNSDYDGPFYTYERSDTLPYSSMGENATTELYFTSLDIGQEYDFGYVTENGSFEKIKTFTGEQVTEEFSHYEIQDYTIHNYKNRSDYEITEEGYTHQLRKNGEVEEEFGLFSGVMFEVENYYSQTSGRAYELESNDQIFERDEVVVLDDNSNGGAYIVTTPSETHRWNFRFLQNGSVEKTENIHYGDINLSAENLMTKVDRFDNNLEVHFWNESTEEFELKEEYDMRGYDNYRINLKISSNSPDTNTYKYLDGTAKNTDYGIYQRGQNIEPFTQTPEPSIMNFDRELVFYSDRVYGGDPIEYKVEGDDTFRDLSTVNIGTRNIEFRNIERDNRKTVHLNVHPTEWETLDINDREKIPEEEEEGGLTDSIGAFASSPSGIGITALLLLSGAVAFFRLR